jgi:hypothetical protein
MLCEREERVLRILRIRTHLCERIQRVMDGGFVKMLWFRMVILMITFEAPASRH